jgi:glutamate 5-kinase
MSETDKAAAARPAVAAARRVVIKVGTRVLTREDGKLSLVRLYRIVEVAAALRDQGREVLLVSSGAIGAGREALGLATTPTEVAARQACAAIGQSRLMALYQQGFGPLGLLSAQVLLTEADFDDRNRYLNLRAALTHLLSVGVVPIINENDTVSTAELALHRTSTRPVFGDNDRLSALVASELDADLLVLLTDVAGIYDKNPRDHADARLIPRVDEPECLQAETSGTTSGVGRGGMASKIEAATIASRFGCHAVIASGFDADAAARVVAGDEVGTWFPATGSMSARRRWIAFATRPQAVAYLDAGAVEAIVDRGGSVLPAGVKRLDGEFAQGDVIELRGPDGEVLGRGIARTDSASTRAWMAGAAPAGVRTLVRRQHLVLEGAKR